MSNSITWKVNIVTYRWIANTSCQLFCMQHAWRHGKFNKKLVTDSHGQLFIILRNQSGKLITYQIQFIMQCRIGWIGIWDYNAFKQFSKIQSVSIEQKENKEILWPFTNVDVITRRNSSQAAEPTQRVSYKQCWCIATNSFRIITNCCGK